MHCMYIGSLWTWIAFQHYNMQIVMHMIALQTACEKISDTSLLAQIVSQQLLEMSFEKNMVSTPGQRARY